MKLFMFSYNVVLILLYSIAMFMMGAEYYINRSRKIYLYGTGVYLFYILDAFVIFAAEFLVHNMSTDTGNFSDLITFPLFKVFICAGISFLYIMVFQEILRLNFKWYQIFFMVLPIPLFSLITILMPASAVSIWLFYTCRQVWAICFTAGYFLILKKHKEKSFYGYRFKNMMIVYLVFLFLIIIEDSIFIPAKDFIITYIPWLNERNLSKDLMTIVILVFVFRMLSQSIKEERELKEKILQSAIKDRDELTLQNIKMQEKVLKLEEELTQKSTVIAPFHEYSYNEKSKTFTDYYGITEREKDVFDLILSGYTNQEIAKELYISIGTVKWHTHQIYEKTGCQRRAQLIALYNSEK